MLSRNLLRDSPDVVRELLEVRGADAGEVDRWHQLDARWRACRTELEELLRRRNEESKAIGVLKREGKDASAAIEAVAELKRRIPELEGESAAVETELRDLELSLPNLPHESVPRGADESANRVERMVGEPREFDFEPQAHWDLGPALGILDFERAAKVAGARFTTYFGAGARLERSLINFMLDLHTGEHGYRETLPPFIVNSDALIGTGQLPKFGEDLFRLEGHRYYLVPTAEVPLTNLYREEILAEADLPMKLTAFTPCFRAEAGSHGKDVPRPDPSAPVQQGGAGTPDDPGTKLRQPRAAHRPRRAGAAAARATLSSRHARDR